MTPERAQEIISKRTTWGSLPYSYVDGYGAAPSPDLCIPGEDYTDPDGITPEEDKFIKEVWHTMSGYTCYFDALCKIANNKHNPNRETLAEIKERM